MCSSVNVVRTKHARGRRAAASLSAIALCVFLCAALHAQSTRIDPWPREVEAPDAPKPSPAPRRLVEVIGAYGPESNPVYVLEHDGKLFAVRGREAPQPITAAAFTRDARGAGRALTLGGATYGRLPLGPSDGSTQLRVDPLRPVRDLLAEAATQQPPTEAGAFRPADLVELATIDPSIKLDVRYATTNNFLGVAFYSQARAFLQRPAAEAVARASAALHKRGYGLLVHDGYRPWYITKAFWDATPDDKKWLVANPASGSKHNRGCAVDLTLYDLATGKVIEMPSTYDESTQRAYAFYPGGTDLQRWHRALLRRAMEAEGFTVNPREWWHFDYKDWKEYAIGNVRFEQIK
jgi:D-alanyl-D-alanine dipeptidase